mmetsp:Transcript_1704/g.2130  ORF Transcript_1704/g.2130 Transcript_1704/m.2130 type:complete len:118 (-) Transcript_1704:242-595(-)
MLVGTFLLIFFTPLYVNIFLTYSIANLHDISWGNRATNSEKGDETQKSLEQFRAGNLILWLSANLLYSYLTIYLQTTGQTTFLLVVGGLLTFNMLYRIVTAVIFTIKIKFTYWCINC